MARLIVFQHGPYQNPGRLGMTLRDHGFKLDIRRSDLPADEGGGLPPDYDDVRGVISLGGPQRVAGAEPWIAGEVAYLAGAHQRGLPLVGVCLGSQLIATALGGEVGPAEQPEIGFTRVDLSVPGQTDTILAGVPWGTNQFQMHADEIKRAPAGATVLASSEACAVQCFRAGMRTYGFQFHFECDRATIERYCAKNPELLAAHGLSADELARQSDAHYATFARAADRLSLNLATFAFPYHALLSV